MTIFNADYLTNLAAELTAQLLPVLGRRLQSVLTGPETTQAIERSMHKGIVALVAQASVTAPEHEALLADIFTAFFAQAEVAQEIARLLRGQEWDQDELLLLFSEAGYDAETLPGLELPLALDTFAVAFLVAITAEPTLQGTLQTNQLLTQTRLQTTLVAQMQQVIDLLKQARHVGIQAGEIRATNVVSGTQIIYQWPGEAEHKEDALWESFYLRTLLTHCDALDLAAIDEAYLSAEGAEAVHLSDVFTPLYLAQDGQLLTRQPDEPVEKALRRSRQKKKDQMPEGRDEAKKAEPIPAVAVMAHVPRLVILGYPGGGKSTLVNYVAAQLAARRLGQATTPDALPGWPETTSPLPLRIILRRFAATLPEQPAAEERANLVWRYIQQQLEQWGCGESFPLLKRTLVEEGGIVLFDGLDEVRETDADTRRTLIKEAITAFAAQLHHCRIVVTCRDYAYQRDDAWRLPEATFPVFTLPLFVAVQIEHFTNVWYRKIGPLKGWDGPRCEQEAQKLFQAIQAYRHLQELAQYPLLLTLMAQVHGRDGYLPEDRADLYERAVKLLLAHWENRLVREVEGGQQVEPGLVIQLGVRVATLRSALARVAFSAHERQEQEPKRNERTADIQRVDLQDELEAELGSADKAKTVLRYIQQRAGLLQARDRYTYTFPHRTFQEYLAAAHIWQQPEPGRLLYERVQRDAVWWREVFLLAAGMQKDVPSNVANLVSELLFSEPSAAPITPLQATLSELAGQALHETGFARHVTPGVENRLAAVFQRTQKWLLAAIRSHETVPARQRAAAGRVLGLLGDTREGVGVVEREGIRVPDIVWGETVPAGTYVMGGDRAALRSFDQREIAITRPYRLACYPVTYAQFDCFVQAGDFHDERWWDGMPAEEEAYGQLYQLKELSEPAFPFANYPRERVSWYQAIAFCRWLSHKLGYEIELPHEYEWEAAARYPDNRLFPWGNEFDPEKANTSEGGIGSTTAVGIYPSGANVALGLYDLSGNVWEWCGSKLENPDEVGVDASGDMRVLRGGSWDDYLSLVRAASRDFNHPSYRDDGVGFRVVCRPTTQVVPFLSGLRTQGRGRVPVPP